MANYKGAYPIFFAKARELFPDISYNDAHRLIRALRSDIDISRVSVEAVPEVPIADGPKPLTEYDRFRGVRPPVSGSFEDGDTYAFTGAWGA